MTHERLRFLVGSAVDSLAVVVAVVVVGSPSQELITGGLYDRVTHGRLRFFVDRAVDIPIVAVISRSHVTLSLRCW